MRYFTSDTHFGHQNIIRYCDRPFKSVSHMNQTLIDNWNDTVSPNDEVYHLGDVALGPWTEWDGLLTRLNGTIHLVIGNHDRIFAGESEPKRDRFYPHYANWFFTMSDHITNFPVAERLVNLSHFPYDGDSHDGDRYTSHRLEDKGRPLIHGHTHDANQWASLSNKGTHQFHVGVDAHGYRPVAETTIAIWLDSIEEAR